MILPLKQGTFVSELPVVPKTQAVKVEITKKVRLDKEIEGFFVFSTLTAHIIGTTGSSETLCTSL